jgi:hypothetical protein
MVVSFFGRTGEDRPRLHLTPIEAPIDRHRHELFSDFCK